jgi:hypothetical protein
MGAVIELPVLPQPNPELEQQALSWPDRAKGLAVVDQQSYAKACEFEQGLDELERMIIAEHAESKKKAFEAHRAICAQERRSLDPVTEAKNIFKRKRGAYEVEQKRIAEERDRLARAEAERIALENREKEIEEAEAAGADIQEVQAIAEMPMVIPRLTAAQSAFVPMSGGTAKKYKARVAGIAGIRKLCQAVADGVVPHTLVIGLEVVDGGFSCTALNQMANALKGVMQVPGVVIDEDFVSRTRRR